MAELDPTYESIELPVSWQKASVYGYRRSYLSGNCDRNFYLVTHRWGRYYFRFGKGEFRVGEE